MYIYIYLYIEIQSSLNEETCTARNNNCYLKKKMSKRNLKCDPTFFAFLDQFLFDYKNVRFLIFFLYKYAMSNPTFDIFLC